jgi:hypothetical protein
VTLAHDELERLVPQWAPGVWVAAVKRACGPLNELLAGDGGVVVDTHPSHSLLVLWKPPKSPLRPPFLRRLPWLVTVEAVADADAALHRLLRHLPHDVPLCMARAEDVDWALMADIVLRSERALEPFLLRELQAFADAERAATRAAIDAGYDGDDERADGSAPAL